jgi:DNA-binding winged helix-turn-helix (wHTH) protein
VRLLGAFELGLGDQTVAVASRPAQLLFAYLVLTAGTNHRREKLAGLLWPDSLEETAQDNLRHALWRLRKGLPASPGATDVLADNLTIAFNAEAEYRLDAQVIERASEGSSTAELMAPTRASCCRASMMNGWSWRSTRIPLLPLDQQEYERNVSSLPADLEKNVFENPWSKGRAMPLEQAMGFALEGPR